MNVDTYQKVQNFVNVSRKEMTEDTLKTKASQLLKELESSAYLAETLEEVK